MPQNSVSYFIYNTWSKEPSYILSEFVYHYSGLWKVFIYIKAVVLNWLGLGTHFLLGQYIATQHFEALKSIQQKIVLYTLFRIQY